MSVTVDDVKHIAQLARLGVDDARARTLVEELNRILGHMAVLERVDTARVTPASGVGDGGMPLRDDEGEQLPLARTLETFAPSMKDGFFVVPRLASHESAQESLE